MKRGLNGIFSGSGPNAITTSATLSGIDLIDLSRGEGEWRNMQDIIRRSFRILFEQIESQQGQINSLTESYNTLKKDQLKKMDISDMNSYFDSKMVTYARAASIDDVNTLRGHITELRSNLERKANIRYVDDLLQRKANKSDLIMHQPQGQSSGVNLSSQLIEQINSKMYSMEQRMASMETMVKLSSEHENTLIKHQLHEVRSQLLGKVDKRDLETAMLTRVERTEFDLQLHQKVDRNHLNERLACIENVLAEHEMNLTTLSFGNSPSSHRKMTEPPRSQYSSYSAVDASTEDGQQRFKRLLSEGRSEALKQVASSRVDSTAQAVADLEYHVREVLEKKVQGVDEYLKKIAAWESVLETHTQEIKRFHNLDISLDALQVQIQELRDQQGVSLKVPLSSIVLNLEKKIADLDQLIQAEIVMEDQERSNRMKGIEDLRRHTAYLAERVQSLTTELEFQQEQYPPLPPSPAPSPSPPEVDTPTMIELKARIEKLESFCTISESKSIYNIQDLVNAFRSVRHLTSKLEERLHQVMMNRPHPQPVQKIPDMENNSEKLKHLKSMVKNLSSRVESCEVIDQVHQVRMDSLEECLRKHHTHCDQHFIPSETYDYESYSEDLQRKDLRAGLGRRHKRETASPPLFYDSDD